MKCAEKATNIKQIIGEECPLLFFLFFFFGCDFNSPVFSTSENKHTQKRHVWRWVWGPSSRGFVRIPSGFSKVDEKVLGVSLSLKRGVSFLKDGWCFFLANIVWLYNFGCFNILFQDFWDLDVLSVFSRILETTHNYRFNVSSAQWSSPLPNARKRRHEGSQWWKKKQILILNS